MKALEKDRNRRYDTANSMAADLQRYLNDEPGRSLPTIGIVSVPQIGPATQGRNLDGWPCRNRHVRRNCRQHLASGSALRGWNMSKAICLKWPKRHAPAKQHYSNGLKPTNKKARTETAKSQQVAAFMKQMLGGVAPSVAMGRDTTMLREILDTTAARLDKELIDQPAVEADLRSTLGIVYSDLGNYTNAEAMHRRALDLRRKLYGNEHPDVADSLQNLGIVLISNKAITPRPNRCTARRWRCEKSYSAMSILLWLNPLTACPVQSGAKADRTRAKPLREALAMQKKLLGNDDLAVAATLHGLSNIFHHDRKYAAAETPLREALAIEKKQLGDENATVAGTLLDLGWVLELQNKYAEAESVLREGMAIHKKIYGKQSWVSLYVLGSTLLGENKLVEAEAADREAVATFKTGTSSDRFLPELHSKFATILRREGKLGEAETVARSAEVGREAVQRP